MLNNKENLRTIASLNEQYGDGKKWNGLQMKIIKR